MRAHGLHAAVLSLTHTHAPRVAIPQVDKKGIKIIGAIKKGLPTPTVGWWAPMPDFVDLIPIAIVVMLVRAFAVPLVAPWR